MPTHPSAIVPVQQVLPRLIRAVAGMSVGALLLGHLAGCQTAIGTRSGADTEAASATGTGTSLGGSGGSSALPSGTAATTTDGGTTVTGIGGSGGTGVSIDCDAPPAPRAPLRRITRFEYNNTVRDLLGISSRPADSLPGEELGSGFGNDADALGVSRLLVDGYRSIARNVALEVTGDAAAVASVAGCDPVATGEDACQQQFLGSYLERAFRRPPSAEDLSAYQTTFADGVSLGGDFASGVRAVVERSLQSPQFLYRIEVGESVDAARNLAQPTDYEMATRLSYLLWGTMPDQTLLDAAAQGMLGTREGVLAQATRMLEDPRARDSLRYFHGQLFAITGLDHLERDTEYYPTFQPGMGALFRQETETFLDYVVWEGAGDLSTIFTAPYTFVNETLATFYGISGVTGDTFQRVDVDTSKRAGLLTQASIMTLTTPGSRTDPVVRGKWLYTRTLCGEVPDPPPNIPEAPDPVPGQSARDRLAVHEQDPACGGCHSLIDPIGLAFEHYDGVGLWRDTDDGAVIDDSGEIPATGIDVAGPFQGALEFAQKVSQSSDVRSCYAGRYLSYAYGRAISQQDDCSRAAVSTAFDAAGGDVKALMLAVTQSDGFLLRQLAADGQ